MSDETNKINNNINKLIAERWSPRIFDPNKFITKEQIKKICEAARWAPSCANEQPYRYIIWNKKTNKIDFEKAFETLDKGNKDWVINCPIIILALANSKFSNGSINNWAEYDTGAASENICLQATDLGLHAHQMAGFDNNKISLLFNIPPTFKPMAMIAIGYKSDDFDLVPSKVQSQEQSDRKRKPIGNNFYDSKWNNPIYK